MKRWLAGAGTLLALLVLAAVGLSYVLRLELATRLLERLLAARGLTHVQLRVTALEPRHAVIEGIVLGDGREVEAGRLRVQYHWRDLPRPAIRSVALEGARMRLDLREGAPRLGSLQAPLERLAFESTGPFGTADVPPPPLPAILIRAGHAEVITADGPVGVDVDLDMAGADAAGVSAGELRLTLHNVARDDLKVRTAKLRLPFRLGRDADELSLAWHDGAEVVLQGLEGLPLDERAIVGLSSRNGKIDVRLDDRYPTRTGLEFELAMPALAIRAEEGVLLQIAPARIYGTLTGAHVNGSLSGQLDAGTARVDLVDPQLALVQAHASVPLGANSGPIELTRALLIDAHEPRRFPSLSLRASLTPGRTQEAPWLLQAEVTALDKRVGATVDATLEPSGRAGQLRLELTPVRFAPGRLQPGQLHSAFGALRDVRGWLRATAQLTWDGQRPMKSSADISMSDVSFRAPTVRLEGLDAVVHLADLFPPHSARGQRVSARAIEIAGVRFSNARARFRILGPASAEEAAAARLHLESASLHLGRGRLHVADVMLDPQSDRRDFVVELEALQLEDLFRLADIEDMSGAGAISGSIPVRTHGEAIEIRDGLLESTDPGLLKIKSAYARSALESAGESVELMLQALEDFHYETLRITLKKPTTGTSKLGIHVLGHNPAVLDGHPFALNINVETDLEPLLRAVSLGTRFSEEWLRGAPRSLK